MTRPIGDAPLAHAAGSSDLPLLVADAGSIRATFAPSRGGRLLSLAVSGEELLWQNPAFLDEALQPTKPMEQWPQGEGGMGTWANLGGSKTWPAPQGWDGPDMWAGPPDVVLDGGAWHPLVFEEASTLHVRMVSPDDHRSGLRITREFIFGSSTDNFIEQITFENVVERTVRWSPWEVCQVATSDGGIVLFEGASEGEMRDLGTHEGTAIIKPCRRGVSVETGRGVTKHGCFGGTGAVSYQRASGTTLTLSIPVQEAADYPDDGCHTEVWLQRPTASPIASLEGLHPDAHLAELEVLGPLSTLEPSDSSMVVVTWSLGRAEP